MMPGIGGIKRSNSGGGSQQTNGIAHANGNVNGNTNAVSDSTGAKPVIGNGHALDTNGNGEADITTSQQQQHSPQQPAVGFGAVNEHENANAETESVPREEVDATDGGATAAVATAAPPSAPTPMSDFKRSFNHAQPQLST